MYLSFIFILILCQVQFNLGDNSKGTGANESINGLYAADIAVNQTLLDTERDAIRINWDIDTWPEKRYYMKYWDSSLEIDATYLNSTSEIDLSSFGGVEGIWVFPHSRRFGLEFYAYFNKIRSSNLFQKLEIFYYLQGRAELRYFNHIEAVNATYLFKGNESITPGWQSVEFNTTDDNTGTMTFRLEFHTHENGDFAFLDKIIGHYYVDGPPPTTTPIIETEPTIIITPSTIRTTTGMGPSTTTTEPSTISTTTPKDDDGNICNCNCNCQCNVFCNN